MEASGPYIQLLAPIPAFAGFTLAQLEALYRACTLKTLAKGEAASVAGASAGELCIVVSGRLSVGGAYEAGRGDAIEAPAFFGRGPAQATAVALRDAVLLALAWEDFAQTFQANPDLAAALMSALGGGPGQVRQARPAPSRLVVCAAGEGAKLSHPVKEALLAGFETVAEVRVLTRQSFGSGMPGALALDSPEIAHWLQEQELEFDLTLIMAGDMDPNFARDAIAEADEVLFIASGENPALSAFERHALETRGATNCRLLLQKDDAGLVKKASEWIDPRPYAHVQALNFNAVLPVQLLGQAIAGKGHCIAAASTGVYAAAILGALQALEEHDLPAAALAAAGSAILPAGLLACGKLSAAQAIFEELANPMLWKRASRPDAGLYDPVPLDNFLVGAFQGLEIPTAERLFAAVSRSLSAGTSEVHRSGRLHGAVRAGIAPPAVLPPLILEGGNILVSGESETEALIAAARSLTAAPVLSLYAEHPPLGPSSISYRNLTGGALFRAAQTIDKRVRAETVLGLGPGSQPRAHAGRALVLRIPEGITPMDWPQWAVLRNIAYDWTMQELDSRGSG
jgi:CRP-like cAMP-binding protein